MVKRLVLLLGFPIMLIMNISNISLAKQADTPEVSNYVTNLMDKGYRILNDKKLAEAERNSLLAEIIQSNLRYEWMAKYTLGRYRRTLSEAQINDFVQTYERFITKVYIDLSKNYRGEKIKINKINRIDEELSIVSVEVMNASSGKAMKVDYLVHNIKDDKIFKIADIITEGISLINSQQAEFTSRIGSEGIDALIAELKKKYTDK